MEFPELGIHCAVQSCSRLDFLPFECDACHKIFCKDHKTYEQHSCEEGYIKDVKVPVCPLCNQPVPINRGEDPNVKVDEHIQKDCQSDKAKKMYTNRCSLAGCKKKELVPVKCNTCQKNFCIKHRHETDHNCQGHPNRVGGAPRNPPSASRRQVQSTGSSLTSAGRQAQVNRKPQSTTMSQIGAELNRERLQRQQQQRQMQHQPHTAAGFTHTNMSEDEALARAIAASMNDTGRSQSGSGSTAHPTTQAPPTFSSQAPPPPGPTSYEDDEALARAIAASLNDEQARPKPRRPNPNPSSQQRQSSNSDSGCHIS